MESIKNAVWNGVKNKAKKTVLDPLNAIADQNITDVVTTIGQFVARTVRGKFQRSITFTIGNRYADKWMEEALYGILYEYNDIKSGSQLELTNKAGLNDGSGMYYQLDDGTHSMKYRSWNILVCIQSVNTTTPLGGTRANPLRVYTIITYDMSPEFCKMFEQDMLRHRNSLLRIKSDSPTIAVYQDLHESDGWTYWDKVLTINKRKLGTVYLPAEQKKKIVDTINEFFSNKDYYKRHGIAHNLKILLYGPPGPQPDFVQIPTPNGFRRIGDIQPGDEVFAPDGTKTKVEYVVKYNQEGLNHLNGLGELNMHIVNLEGGRNIIVGDNHKLLLTNPNTGEDKIMTIEQLEVIDDARLPLDCEEYDVPKPADFFFIRSPKPAEMDERPVIMDPYAAGALFASQYVDEYNSIDLNITDRVRRFSIEMDYMSDYPGTIIPSCFKFNSVDNRIAFVNGVTDYCGQIESCGDGYVSVFYPFVNVQFAYEFIEILDSLGIYGSITNVACPDENCDIDELLFEVTVNVNKEQLGMLFKDFKVKLRKGTFDHPVVTGIRILGAHKEKFTAPMTCLHVEHPSHMYLTSGYIPICNSGKDSIAKMIASEWNRNIYYVTGGKNGKFIPNAIVDDSEEVNYPMILISDIDKYPFLINEADLKMDENAKEESIGYKQCFGSMINALDGVLSAEDRIIVMTTNHIEKFSQTFLRPGRIDLLMEIGYVTPEVFRKYVWDFYHVALPENIKLKSNKLSVADLQFDVVFAKMGADEFIAKHTK